MFRIFKRRLPKNVRFCGNDMVYQKANFYHESHPKEVPKFEWVDAPNDDEDFPEGMVCGGKLETGQLAYIASCRIEDEPASGFVVKESRVAYFPYGTVEHIRKEYKVLTVENPDSLVWMKCRDGQRPDTPLVPISTKRHPPKAWEEKMLVGRTCTNLTSGHTFDNQTLEVTPWAMTGSEIHRPGKIHPSQGALYVPYSGREYIFNEHEMLMMKITPGSLKSICRYQILKHISQLKNNGYTQIDKLPLPLKLINYLSQPKWMDK